MILEIGPLGIFLHLLNFAAPAAVVALLVAFAAWVVAPGRSVGLSFWACFAINFIVSLSVLAAGLWYWSADGKMATYALLAVSVGTGQWMLGRFWPSQQSR